MHVDAVLPHRVSPFGNLRINAYVPLPVAYRSLSRPSSAPDAKAFPLRSYQLDHFFWFSERIMQVTEVFISRSNCSFTHNSTKNLFAPPFGEAPSVALLFSHLFHCSVFKVQIPVKDRIKTLKLI